MAFWMVLLGCAGGLWLALRWMRKVEANQLEQDLMRMLRERDRLTRALDDRAAQRGYARWN